MWSVRHADHRLGVAVRVGGVDAVDAGVDRLLDGPGRVPGSLPMDVVNISVPRFTEMVGTKRGLASALHSGDPAFAGLPDYFLERLGPTLSAVLDAAAAEGAIRGDIGAEDLLYAVAQLYQPVPGRGSEHNRRIVGVLVDGLRWRGEQRRP
jgi:hypothetical protein